MTITAIYRLFGFQVNIKYFVHFASSCRASPCTTVLYLFSFIHLRHNTGYWLCRFLEFYPFTLSPPGAAAGELPTLIEIDGRREISISFSRFSITHLFYAHVSLFPGYVVYSWRYGWMKELYNVSFFSNFLDIFLAFGFYD